jgi:hypothetical protein
LAIISSLISSICNMSHYSLFILNSRLSNWVEIIWHWYRKTWLNWDKLLTLLSSVSIGVSAVLLEDLALTTPFLQELEPLRFRGVISAILHL